jgi:hypothetical protein
MTLTLFWSAPSARSAHLLVREMCVFLTLAPVTCALRTSPPQNNLRCVGGINYSSPKFLTPKSLTSINHLELCSLIKMIQINEKYEASSHRSSCMRGGAA